MKYLPILKYILLILGFVAGVLSMTGSVDGVLYMSYILLGITVALAVIMPLASIAQNPKTASKALVGIGVLGAICAVSWILASDEPITLASGDILDNPFALKIADLQIFATYITFAGALLAIVTTEIYKIFK